MTDYKIIFDTLYRKLCLYAAHYVADIDTAEDIVMETITKAYELEKNGREITNVKGYFFHAVRNRCLDKLHDREKVRSISLCSELEDDTDNGKEELDREDWLWTTIDGLPHQCRRIFLMSKRDGLKYQEIADTLGLSVKTVEAQIGKAYKILRGKAMEIYFFLFFL